MASSGQSSEIAHLVALIKTLTNPQLKDLLRNEGLAVSGVKISLQLRIIDCSFLPLDLFPVALSILCPLRFPSGNFLQNFDESSRNPPQSGVDLCNELDLERLANSEGNGARYDALRRLIYHTAVPGASSFQTSTGFQLQPPTVSHPPPSQARSTPLGASMSPHSHTGLPRHHPIFLAAAHSLHRSYNF
jgi:E3 SUMO-protein ligase PIAS1